MIVFTSLDIFQNLLSNWELFNILDNSEELIKLLNDFELCDINSISNYFDYVILCKILSAENNLSYIKDNNNKLLIKKICDLSSQILENINNKMVIDFINSNYLSVIGTDIAVINLRSSTISLISKFIAGIKSPVFEYICKEYNYLIINNFESFYKIIVDNINLFDILFHKYSYEEVYQLRVEKVLQVWTYILNKNNCELKNKVLFLTKELCNDIVTNYEKYSSNNLLSFSKDLHELYNHLKITRNPLANEFSNVILKIENQVSEYLISNGSHFEFEIPVSDIIKRIMNILSHKQIFYEEEAHASVISLLIKIARRIESNRECSFDEFKPYLVSSKFSDVVSKAIEYISDNYTKDIKVSELASYLYMSEVHLRRVFDRYMSIGVLEYINLVRISEACKMLKNSTKTINDIANSCGFNDISTFNRNFKRFVGYSPNTWRKDIKNYEYTLLKYKIHTEEGWW